MDTELGRTAGHLSRLVLRTRPWARTDVLAEVVARRGPGVLVIALACETRRALQESHNGHL
jgi:hypothetical protein